MADIAVQSSLSPLDALYKETRAQRKAARASSSTAPAATSVHETAQSAARTKGLLARIDSLKSRTNHVDARPPPPPTRQSSLKYNYDHQNASTRSSRDSDAMPRASILTVESANGDPFHYEAYASRPTSLTSHAEIEGVDPYLSRIPSNVTPRDSADIQQLSPRSPLSASSASPKSMSDERFQDIDTPPGPSPALSQRSFASLDPSSAAGRAPSQIAIRNYSRPSSSITTTTRSTRSVSNASSISTSGPPSSIGHSSSSHAASLSSSWDHRRQFELEKEELLAAECRASTSRLSGPSSRPEPASISTPVAIASSQRSSSPRGEPSVTFEEPASSPRKRSWSKRTSRPAAPAETDRLSASTVRASDYAAEPRRPHFAQSPSTLVKSSSNNNYRDSTLSFRDSPAAASMHRAQQSLRKAHFGDDSTQSSHSLFNLAQPSTPQEYLHAGINEHESGDLEKAAALFAKSATSRPPCAGGMLMYGLTLRHGWGCPVDAEAGFGYIQAAAELISADLDRVVSAGRVVADEGLDAKATRNELMLALHEIGTSLRFGWGVKKDKKAAVEYFRLAADMGDVDAQQDLAFCYANGKGCKKDLKLAAKYYRLSIAQGAPSFGLSWVFKPKWDE